jgi:lysophospholipase L1-like esterase
MFGLLLMSRNYLKKKLRHRLGLGGLLVAALVVGACGGSTPTTPTPTPPTTPPVVAGAPAVTCPASITIGSPNGAPVPVTYTVPTATGGVAPVTVSCAPASGSPFPVTMTTVQCTATASDNQTGSCSFPVTVTPPIPQLTETNFLAFGDSLTQGEVSSPVATSSDANGFPSFGLQIVASAAYPRQLQLLLAARYTQQNITVSNFGVAGESATNGAKRFPNVIANARPDVVLLLEGANDLSALGQAGFSTAVAAVESMAKEARFRNARVFIGTLPPPRPGGKNTITAATVQQFNTRLASIAAGERAVLVDLYGPMLSGVNTYIGTDGLHPTELGYQKIAEIFNAAIRADLEVRLSPTDIR